MRHRELDDLPPIGNAVHHHLSTEIRNLVKQSPSLKLVFLCPTAKDALLRYGTWLAAFLNTLDNQASMPSDSLVYAMPTIFVDIPFEMFRVFKRAN